MEVLAGKIEREENARERQIAGRPSQSCNLSIESVDFCKLQWSAISYQTFLVPSK